MPQKVQAEPGVYPKLSYREYDAIDAWRRGVICAGRKSMAHLRYARDNPKPATKDMLFGQALHSSVFEPADFEKRVALAPINPKTQKPYGLDSDKAIAFMEQNPNLIVLGGDDRETLIDMGQSLRDNADTAAFLYACLETELTLVWRDEHTGVMCKTRLDGICNGGADGLGVVDLKSTGDASPAAFARDCFNYGYHIQGAMALDALKTLGRDELDFTLIAVEKDGAYEATYYTLDQAWIEKGQETYRSILAQIAECEELGVWPGYVSGSKLVLASWMHERA